MGADTLAAPRSATSSATPPPASPASTASVIATASSSSSIVPPSPRPETEQTEQTEQPESKPKKAPKPNSQERAEALAKLEAKIKALRAARKADGPDGRPAKNRQELIEARRKKQEEMQEKKKAAKKVAREEEKRLEAEAELERMRGSGSPSGLLTPDLFASRPLENNFNFSFGRVAFDDGQQVDSKLSGLVASKKRKGPSDPRTALEAAKKKRVRMNGLDEEKKAEIVEKDAWLNAKKKAHGEKVRDDESLLLKTLKRKKKTKLKSEKEWNERLEGVQHGKEMRQKKREANLQKRRDGKKDKKNKVKGSKVKKPAKKVKRPGFEGSFRSKAK